MADAVRALTADPAKAVELTGAIVNDAGRRSGSTRRAKLGEVRARLAAELTHPAYPGAVVRTPMIVKVTDGYGVECFGPVTFAVPTESTADSIRIFRETVEAKGALTAAVYSTDESVLDAVELAAVEVGVHLSANLTGGVFVNQSAAFSDFHASGANPAANAALTDGAFVASRFRIVQSRRPA